MEKVCFNICWVLCTFIAAIEFYSHGDMAMPLLGINTNIASLETGEEAIIHDGVPVAVAREHLIDKQNRKIKD